MKTIFFVSLIYFAIAMSVHAELTPQDLDKIRLIIKEEISPLKADIETLKISVARLEERLTGDVAQLEGRLTGVIARVDGRANGIEGRMSGMEGRLGGIEKQISHSTNVTYGLIALIVVAIGLPAWRGKRDRDQERKMEELTREIEALKQQRIVSS